MAPRSVEASEPQLYDYWREGDAFSYAIPVPNGRWRVTIHTFEPRPAAPDSLTMTVKANGATVYLLTVEKALEEKWARHACDEVHAVKTFADRRGLINAVAYLMRTRKIDRIVALDDFDVEVAAFLREHFRMTGSGHGESTARLFRDKLAMRQKAVEVGVLEHRAAKVDAFMP